MTQPVTHDDTRAASLWDHEAAAEQAAGFMKQGFHCSEAVLLAAGEAVMGAVDPMLCRASSGLAGGVGCGYGEMCGALSAGAMVIGLLHGRSDATTNDDFCQRLSRDYRERFIETFGDSNCGKLRASGYGAGGHTPCSVLVARATRLLLELLEDAASES